MTLLLFASLFSLNTTQAHTGNTCNAGSENVGWMINCGVPNGHAGTTAINYNTNSANSKYTAYATTGASRWNNTGVVSIRSSISASNSVSDYSQSGVSTVASVRSTVNQFTGHKTGWTMRFNRAIMDGRSDAQNRGTATHEFGHTIGLRDLQRFDNTSKLMYGYSSRTATSPTTTDITGARQGVR